MALDPTRSPSEACRPIDDFLTAVLPTVKAFRRDLHAHPELGYQEHRTAEKVKAALAECAGWEIRTGLAGTGLIATLGADLAGPAVALRADMDALPIEETSGAPHASKTPGVMHACGHDGHTAMLVGAARILSEIRDELSGPVRLVFQPAEEGGAGGRAMVEAGALRDPEIEAIFGLHNMPSPATHAGQLCLCPGAVMAGTATWDITVRGRGGHAAAPHATIDPIFVGANILTAIQGIVSRNTDPVESAVVTCTQFHAGNAYNVIPETAVLRGTIRALDEKVMADTCRRLETQAAGIASALGGRAEVTITPGYPVTRNHARSDALWRQVVADIGRGDDLVEVPPMLGGEDFAFYQQVVPGTFWFLAARPADVPEVPFCHHPSFDFNDDILADGIRLHVELARRFADKWQTTGTED